MWLKYEDKAGNRELYIFEIAISKPSLIHRFTKADGIITDIMFLKSNDNRSQKYIFYVKDTTMVVKFNIGTKSTELIGQTKEPILAMCVTHNELRSVDKGEAFSQEQSPGKPTAGSDPEKKDPGAFFVVTLDEGRNITVFSKTSET